MVVKKDPTIKPQISYIKKFRPWVLLALAVVLLALLYRNKTNSKLSEEVLVVRRTPFTKTVIAEGKIVAKRSATLNFITSGKLSYLGIAKGDSVRKYQRLASLDSHSLLAAVKVTQRQLDAAEANVDEVEDTLQGHDLDESFAQRNIRTTAQSTRDIAYENWIDARRSVGDMSLYAPFNGIVTQTTINTTGDIVSLTDSITIIDPESLYFQASVDEADYANIKKGQKVIINLDAFPEKEFIGRVGYIEQGGTKAVGGGIKVIVDVDLESFVEPLITELSGEARFILSEEPSFSLPRDYVFNKAGKFYVLVKKEGKIKEVEVILGFRSGDRVEILSGLIEGDQVVKKEH